MRATARFLVWSIQVNICMYRGYQHCRFVKQPIANDRQESRHLVIGCSTWDFSHITPINIYETRIVNDVQPGPRIRVWTERVKSLIVPISTVCLRVLISFMRYPLILTWSRWGTWQLGNHTLTAGPLTTGVCLITEVEIFSTESHGPTQTVGESINPAPALRSDTKKLRDSSYVIGVVYFTTSRRLRLS